MNCAFSAAVCTVWARRLGTATQRTLKMEKIRICFEKWLVGICSLFVPPPPLIKQIVAALSCDGKIKHSLISDFRCLCLPFRRFGRVCRRHLLLVNRHRMPRGRIGILSPICWRIDVGNTLNIRCEFGEIARHLSERRAGGGNGGGQRRSGKFGGGISSRTRRAA